MVNIISPKSVYVDNNHSSTYMLQWEGSIQGQQTYEVLYRQKGNDTWLTTGRVTSSDTSYDLRNIHTLIDIDFFEIEYKVVLTYNMIDESETKSETTIGTESSNVYTLIFNQGVSGTLNVWTNTGKKTFPVFDSIKNDNISKWKINTSSGTKMVPLIDEGENLSSNLKIAVTDNKVKTVAGYDTRFYYYTPSASDIFGNFYVNGTYYYYTYNNYYYISQPSYQYFYYSDTTTTYYKSSSEAYQYYNYLSGSVRNYKSYYYKYYNGTTPIYYRSSSGAYQYYNYLRGSYSYIPTENVNVAYLKYSTTYNYSTYQGSGVFNYFAYGYYITRASGTYQDNVVTYSNAGGGPGYSFSNAFYAPAILPYYYYTYANLYAYDRTYYYYYYHYANRYYTINYAHGIRYYYTYTNTYAYDRTYYYYYYHYANRYYTINYAYRYTDDVYSFRSDPISQSSRYNYTYLS